MNQTPRHRQTLMWTATWPRQVQGLARDFQNTVIQVNVGSMELAANSDVHQHIVFLEGFEAKCNGLIGGLKDLGAKGHFKVLIVTATKAGADGVTDFLNRRKFPADAVHGDKDQRQRERIMNTFKHRDKGILVATDVAQRGLDIQYLPAVVNFDFPQQREDYVHRIGRTGRAGKRGDACSFFTSNDAHSAGGLIALLKKAGQEVPDELDQYSAYGGGYGGGGYGGGRSRYRGR